MLAFGRGCNCARNPLRPELFNWIRSAIALHDVQFTTVGTAQYGEVCSSACPNDTLAGVVQQSWRGAGQQHAALHKALHTQRATFLQSESSNSATASPVSRGTTSSSGVNEPRGTRDDEAQQQQHPHFAADDDGTEGGDEEEEEEDLDLRVELLKAALQHVPAEGWSMTALQEGARELGYSPAAAGVVEGGETALVQFFLARCNADLADRLDAMQPELAPLSCDERLLRGARMRLEMLVPYIDSWPQALALQSSPGAAPRALEQLLEAVDEIWRAAGDQSTDVGEWYSKRAALAGAYASCELYMLTDSSPGFADTWSALGRRLAEARLAGEAVGRLGSLVGGALATMGGGLADAMRRPRGGSAGPGQQQQQQAREPHGGQQQAQEAPGQQQQAHEP